MLTWDQMLDIYQLGNRYDQRKSDISVKYNVNYCTIWKVFKFFAGHEDRIELGSYMNEHNLNGNEIRRLIRLLNAHGVFTVEDLLSVDISKIKAIDGAGPRTLDFVRALKGQKVIPEKKPLTFEYMINGSTFRSFKMYGPRQIAAIMNFVEDLNENLPVCSQIYIVDPWEV